MLARASGDNSLTAQPPERDLEKWTKGTSNSSRGQRAAETELSSIVNGLREEPYSYRIGTMSATGNGNGNGNDEAIGVVMSPTMDQLFTPVAATTPDVGDQADTWRTALQQWIIRIYHHGVFQKLVFLVIIAASVAIGMQTEPMFQDVFFFAVMDEFVTWFFALELLLNFLSHAVRPLEFLFEDGFWYRPDWWNWFDLVVVVLCFLNINAIAVLRLFRILRVLKLVKAVPTLRMLLSGLIASTASIGYILLLLLIMYFMFGVVGVMLFREDDPDKFGSLPIAIITLFGLSTGSSWTAVMYPVVFSCPGKDLVYPECLDLAPHGLAAVLYFVVFVLLSAMTLLNLIIGVITQSMDSARKENDAIQRAAPLHANNNKCGEQCDTNGDGTVGGDDTSNKNPAVIEPARQSDHNHGHKSTTGWVRQWEQFQRKASLAFFRALKVCRLWVPEEETKKEIVALTVVEARVRSVVEHHEALLSRMRLVLAAMRALSATAYAVADAKPGRKPSVSKMKHAAAVGKYYSESVGASSAPVVIGSLSNKDVGPWLRAVRFCQKIADAKWFQALMFFVTLIAITLVAIQTDPEMINRAPSTLPALEDLVQAMFTVEIIIKTVQHNNRPYAFLFSETEPVFVVDMWNVFDLAVVVAGFLNIKELALLRLFRLLRVMKLIRAVPTLRNLLEGLFRSLSSMCYVLLLLLLVIYIWGIVGMMLFAENDPLHFADLGLAFLTLMQCATSDDWTDILYVNMYGCDTWEGYPQIGEASCNKPKGQMVASVIYFVSLMLLSSLIALNLVIGVINSTMEEATEERKDEMAMKKITKTLHRGAPNGLQPLTCEQHEELANALASAVNDCDGDIVDLLRRHIFKSDTLTQALLGTRRGRNGSVDIPGDGPLNSFRSDVSGSFDVSRSCTPNSQLSSARGVKNVSFAAEPSVATIPAHAILHQTSLPNDASDVQTTLWPPAPAPSVAMSDYTITPNNDSHDDIDDDSRVDRDSRGSNDGRHSDRRSRHREHRRSDGRDGRRDRRSYYRSASSPRSHRSSRSPTPRSSTGHRSDDADHDQNHDRDRREDRRVEGNGTVYGNANDWPELVNVSKTGKWNLRDSSHSNTTDVTASVQGNDQSGASSVQSNEDGVDRVDDVSAENRFSGELGPTPPPPSGRRDGALARLSEMLKDSSVVAAAQEALSPHFNKSQVDDDSFGHSHENRSWDEAHQSRHQTRTAGPPRYSVPTTPGMYTNAVAAAPSPATAGLFSSLFDIDMNTATAALTIDMNQSQESKQHTSHRYNDNDVIGAGGGSTNRNSLVALPDSSTVIPSRGIDKPMDNGNGDKHASHRRKAGPPSSSRSTWSQSSVTQQAPVIGGSVRASVKVTSLGVTPVSTDAARHGQSRNGMQNSTSVWSKYSDSLTSSQSSSVTTTDDTDDDIIDANGQHLDTNDMPRNASSQGRAGNAYLQC